MATQAPSTSAADAEKAKAKAAKQKARKEARAKKQAKLELELAASRKAQPKAWELFQAFVDEVKKIPVEEAAVSKPVFIQTFRNILKPGVKAKSVEKMKRRLARLEEQRAKLLAELGEEA